MTEQREDELIGAETCVMCHKNTDIPRNSHADDSRRLGCYIEGAGQLCQTCFKKIYNH